MSALLEVLGAGLLGQLLAAFENQLPGRLDDSADELRQRRSQSPKSIDLALRHGVACLRSLALREARAAFHDALRLSASPLQPAIGLACTHDEMGQLDESLRYLFMARDVDPNDPAVLFAIAFCHERRGQTAGAVDYYQRAIAACPRLRNAFERLAAIALRQRDVAEAVRCYECLAEFEPDDVTIMLALGSLYLQAGRSLDAIDQFERAVLIEPQTTGEPIEDAAALEASGDLVAAIEKLSAVVEKYPGIADFHVHLGDLLAKAGSDAEAVSQYEAAMELQPGYLEATIKLGTQHLRARRFVEAARTFNSAVELNDRVILAYVGLGVAQHAAGRIQESDATFNLAMSLEPNSTLLLAEAARLQLRAEFEARARLALAPRPTSVNTPRDDLLSMQIRRHRQGLELSPNQADLHYRHGVLLRQTGHADGAARALRQALAINPCYGKALIKLGICLREAGQDAEALTMFARALTLRPESLDVHYELGLLFAQRNQFDLTVEVLESRLADGGQSVALRPNVALALQNLGMLDRAAASWRSICELGRELNESLDTDRSLAVGGGATELE
ncbi:MAG: Beta-barrel assembly-enhancing protease [Phycisphaerae bacterium]|nr:Beta-barrel assembly-enhancing protease [Phycisphaerae bacterium]